MFLLMMHRLSSKGLFMALMLRRWAALLRLEPKIKPPLVSLRRCAHENKKPSGVVRVWGALWC